MKPLYKTALIVTAVAVLGLVVFFIIQRLTTAPALTEPEAPAGERPTAEEEKPQERVGEEGVIITKLSDDDKRVFDHWISSVGEIGYITADGKVYDAKRGPDLETSSQKISALNLLEIGPENRQALVAFGDPKRPDWGVFSLLDNTWRPLLGNIVNAAWGKDEGKLFGILENGSRLDLVRIDLEEALTEGGASGITTIIKDLRLRDVSLRYIGENLLIVSEKPASFYDGRIWAVDVSEGTINLIAGPERSLWVNWVRGANAAFLFSLDARNNKRFFILNEDLEEPTLPLFITLPSKCTANKSKIYCFAPEALPDNSKLPEDYLQKKFFTIDSLYVIDRETGENEVILTSGAGGVAAIDAKNPRVSGDKLYFVNRYDEGLYKIRL